MAQKKTYENYEEITVSCTCGNTFKTKSTYSKSPTRTLKIEICGVCHPYYSGTQKTVDPDRRIDTFYQKYQKAAVKPAAAPVEQQPAVAKKATAAKKSKKDETKE
ncbi:MAG: 50S ribosomal protein L31 [Gammaproteobacteria bacterium]|nr:50S ribosomal protein L31 [Gammaproteobacteria bacterium]